MHPLFFSVRRTQLSLQRHSWFLLEEWDLADEITPVQLDVLRIVYERLMVMRWQLVDLLGVVGPAVSRMLDRLEKKNLIVRSQNELDGRMVEVRLTEYGEDLVKRAMRGVCNPVRAEYHAGVLSNSNPLRDDLALLDRLLLAARINLEDAARFVHPWMRVEMGLGYSLANPPPSEAIFPPRELPDG